MPPAEPPPHDAARVALERHLAWAEGAWFVFAFGGPRGLAGLRARALETVHASGEPTRVLTPATPQQLREVVAELLEGPPVGLVWLEATAQTPPWVEAWDDVLLRLNERREVLRRSLGGGLVLAASPALKARFREAAPDLWSVRSLVLDVDEPSSDDPGTHRPDPRATRANGSRIAEALLRVGFHLRMQRRPWYALVLGDDPAPRHRLLDLLSERHRVVVHAGWSQGLVEPTGADLHWLELHGDPPLALVEALRDEHLSAPLVLAGPRSLEATLQAAPAVASARAFVTRLFVERSVQPSPLPDLEHRQAALDDAWRSLARARALDDPSAEADAVHVHRQRVVHLVSAAEALLLQGWTTEAAPVVEALTELAGVLEQTRPEEPEVQEACARADELASQVARAAGDLPTARDHQHAAIERRRALARSRGPDHAERRAAWARALSVGGELALQAGELDAAASLLGEALDLRRELADRSDDHETLAELATGWSLVGDLELTRSATAPEGLASARQALEEALRLREHLATETDLPRHRRLLSVSWGRLGRVHARCGEPRAARRAFEQAASLARALVDDEPGRPALRMEATVAASLAGDAARAVGDWSAARTAWEGVVEERRQLVREDPENARWQHLLAVSLGRLADASLALGDLDVARVRAREAVELSEQLAWMDPSHVGWQRGLALAWLRRGDVAAARDRDERAHGAWSRALAVVQALEALPGPEAPRRAAELRAALQQRGTIRDEA